MRSAVRSTRKGCARVERARRRRSGVVRTANSSGGSRRHSSHRYDWMPPDLGREVVGDEQMRHARCCRFAAQSATSASTAGSRSRRERRRRPDRRDPRRWAAHSACARTSGSASAMARRRAATTAGVGRRRPRCRAPRARCGGGSGAAGGGMYHRPNRASSSSSDSVEQLEHRHPGLRRSSSAGGGGDAAVRPPGSAGRRPGSRHNRRAGRRARPGTRAGTDPGACTSAARQRRASSTPGATSAPVGHAGRQRRHEPQPSATGSVAAGSGASVRTDPRTNHEPRPGNRTLVFLPYQPSPARVAASRSTSALSSASTRVRQPSASSRPRHLTERGAQRACSDRPTRSGRHVRAGAGRRAGGDGCRRYDRAPDDQRPRARQCARRVGGARRVAVGEVQRTVQPGCLALDEQAHGSDEKGSAEATPTASRPAARPSLPQLVDVRVRGHGPMLPLAAPHPVRRAWRRPGTSPPCDRQADGPGLVHVDHHRGARLSPADEGDDAVVARVGVLHRALVAADRQRIAHTTTLRRGCDSDSWRRARQRDAEAGDPARGRSRRGCRARRAARPVSDGARPGAGPTR